MNIKQWILGVCLLVCGVAYSQNLQKIVLINPSFEDVSGVNKVPRGWQHIGDLTETPPDTHPCGAYECKEIPYHGWTFVGMVTRDNSTWEAISQEFMYGTLLKDQAYTFSIYLAQSKGYVSPSRTTAKTVRYKTPACLRIWGRNRKTGKEELLAVSDAVSHNDWKRYDFVLCPKKNDCTGLLLEVYYFPNDAFPANGNLLIDNCSDLVPIEPGENKN